MTDKTKSKVKHEYHPSVRSILFMSLAIFGFAIMLMIWIVFYYLFNEFYYEAKLTDFEKNADAIASYIESDKLPDTVKKISMSSKLCIRVFEVGTTFNEIISSDIQADCYIHHVPDDEWETYYMQAKEKGGISINEYSLHDLLSGSNSVNPNERSVNLVYSAIISKRSGNTYFLMLDTAFNPMQSLGPVISNQFIFIAVLILIITAVAAIILSKLLSIPMKRMTVTAKQLALGNYDIEFNGTGFSEVHELSETLNYASRELSKNDALQKELIANVSHDLRTPLTLIRGYAEVMKDIPGENTPENVQIIIDETNHLSELVSDMLDLSKIRSGEIAPDFAVFDLTETVRDTILRYKKFTDKNGFVINFKYSENIYVNADRRMILQVVYNFINNAINYSGEIKEITVVQTRNDKTVNIAVTDRGEGIAEDKLQFIWDRYYKLDKNHKIPSVGSGLGLSIAKQVLKAHSASFGVRSKVGNGSTFWFEIPFVGVDPKE